MPETNATNDARQSSDIQLDVVREMRGLAHQGAGVRELVDLLRARMGYRPDVIIPVLGYFVHAFDLRLPEVLPIREWLGSGKDEEIDGIILPAIQRTREKWSKDMGQTVVTRP